jgi:hypothetical protein
MPPTDNAPRRPKPKKPSGAKARRDAAIWRAVQANAAKQQAAKRKTPAQPTKRGLLENAFAQVAGTTKGVASSVGRGDSPAQTQRSVQRNIRQVARRRAVREYTQLPREQRSRVAAAAQKRVAAGRGSEQDRLVVQAHQARTANDGGRSRRAVQAANARHDRAAQAARGRQLQDLIAGIGPKERNEQDAAAPKPKKDKSLFSRLVDDAKSAPGDLVEGTKKNVASLVKGAADATNAAGNAVIKLSEFDPLNTETDTRKAMQAGTDPSGAAKAAVAAPKVLANVARVSADDPSQLTRAVKDVASMVKDLPAGVVATAKDPAGAASATVKDFKRRYGPLLEGKDEEFRARLKKEGIAPEVVDSLGLLSGESAAGARAVSATSKAVARTTKAGSRVNRAANRVERFVNEPRPDLVRTTNVATPQRKAKGLGGIAAQRLLDRRREARVQRETTEAVAKRGGTPSNVSARRARNLDRKVEARGVGDGVRGPLPKAGQVAPLRAAARDRKVRRSTAVVASVGFRRLERLQNELTRDAERRFQSLSKVEQRAAVHALEGTINPADAAASLRAIDKRVASIKAWRNEIKRDDPERWKKEYAPLLGKENSDEVVQLTRLRADIERAPDKVLSPRLTQFVEGEQQRRPRVERVAGDSLRPSTILARRFAPAGELTGTRVAYAPRRAALERLETMTPNAALQQIGNEIKRARARRTPGEPSSKVQDLAMEARAVQQISQEYAPTKRMPAAALDKARTIEAERFAKNTRTAARAQGLGDIEPVFVKHRKRDTAGAGMRAIGGAERGAMAGAKKSDMSLFRRGFRDTSDRAYALGMQESAKRSVQWRMVNELVQDHVPKWSRGKNNRGLTLKEFETAPDAQLLDPKDWVAWRAGREEAHPDSDLPDDTDPITDRDAVGLKDITSVDWSTSDRFFVVPMSAFNEMKRGQGGAESVSRVGSRITGLQSQAILGSNPAYGVRQVLQTVPLTTVAVGGRVLDAAFWRNLKAYRRAAKLQPEQWNDVLDVIGVRSKSADAVRSVRRGDKLDVKRFEGALVNTWGGLFGARVRDYFVSPRNSPGPAGTASQAGRTAGKVALTPFRMIRDGNMMIDAWQDRFARTLALAAKDAKMSKEAASRFGDELAASTAAQAKRMGPLAAALDLPPDQLARVSRSPEFRKLAYEAADGVTKWLGDYANYTQREQKIGRAFVPFYGFARHSTRLLVYTLPLEHPFVFAAVLSQAGVQQRQKEQMLRDYMKKVGREGDIPDMLDGLVLTANGGGELETVDARWLNPLTGPVFEALSSDPATATTGVATPLIKGVLETAFETNAFTKQRLSNADGMSGPSNKLSGLDKGRVITNRVLMSMFPFRAWNELQNGEKGKLTDTSLPFSPTPYPYKPLQSGKPSAAMERNDKKIAEAKRQGTSERLLDSVVPLRGKSAASLLNSAEYEKQNKDGKAPAKKKRKPASGGGFGGGGAFGSGSFGGGGGF